MKNEIFTFKLWKYAFLDATIWNCILFKCCFLEIIDIFVLNLLTFISASVTYGREDSCNTGLKNFRKWISMNVSRAQQLCEEKEKTSPYSICLVHSWCWLWVWVFHLPCCVLNAFGDIWWKRWSRESQITDIRILSSIKLLYWQLGKSIDLLFLRNSSSNKQP